MHDVTIGRVRSDLGQLSSDGFELPPIASLSGKPGKGTPSLNGSRLQLNRFSPLTLSLIRIPFFLIRETKLQMSGDIVW